MQPHRSDNNHKSRTVSEAPPSQDDISQGPLPLAKTQPTAATGKKTRSKKITRKSMKTQLQTGKPIRRKSPGTVMENEFKKGKGYCSVVCRLESICSDSLLCDEIKRTAHAMKQIQLEAWHLVKPPHTTVPRERSFAAGLQRQDLLRPLLFGRSHHGTDASHRAKESGAVVYDPDLPIAAGRQKKEKANLVNAIMRFCYNTDETDLVEALQMRDVLTPNDAEWSEQWVPWPNHIKDNGMGFYVQLLWEFQGVIERRMEQVPNEKGVRAFSLFPVSTNYINAHADRWTVMRHAFDIASFETRRPECHLTKTEFAQLSVEKKYEHASHLFANQLTTDGYGATALLLRSKREVDKSSEDDPVVPAGYMPDIMIGLNPGMRALRTHGEYQAIVAAMPSFKTSSYSNYLQRLEYVWRHVRYLLPFCLDRPFLKWKFFRKRMTRVAVDAIARRIVPTVSSQTCVAYGDWSRRNGIKGHAPSPVKGLKETLRKRATVVSMDEFRTSKLCSQCHQTLSSVRYSVDTRLPKRKKRKGVVLARNRAEVEFEMKKCYAVLRCDHKQCEARYWDRDVNAAINMLELLKSEVLEAPSTEAAKPQPSMQDLMDEALALSLYEEECRSFERELNPDYHSSVFTNLQRSKDRRDQDRKTELFGADSFEPSGVEMDTDGGLTPSGLARVPASAGAAAGAAALARARNVAGSLSMEDASRGAGGGSGTGGKGFTSLRESQRRQLKSEKKGFGSGRVESEAHATTDGVMDERTTLILQKMINRGELDKVYGCVQSGKEAHVYYAVGTDEVTLQPVQLAVKIFRTTLNEFGNRHEYVTGDRRFDLNFQKKDLRRQIKSWTEKEYRNLCRAAKSQIRAPKPVVCKEHVLVMQFLGAEGWPEPTLKDVQAELSRKLQARAYADVLQATRALYQRAHLVHGDLSEYNILFSQSEKRCWLIDFGQAVDRSHPEHEKLLRRDLHTIHRFFQRGDLLEANEDEAGLLSDEQAFDYVVSETPEDVVAAFPPLHALLQEMTDVPEEEEGDEEQETHELQETQDVEVQETADVEVQETGEIRGAQEVHKDDRVEHRA
ncbi:hypothetical protein BBJ28_00008450 [Nothophytophthora sp. Chile5]|nr:hypothetical protein BBJ28_00008450 [Nothophytophthora sp. Chile5]